MSTQLPKKITPTWEMELLISGASVFTLVQLAGQMNTELLLLQIRLHDHHMSALAFPLFLYAKVAVMCLTATFLLHLVLRTYWVGLIGLDSVFPGGPRLEHMKYGRYYKAHLAEHMRDDPATLIERTDNRATVVFGFGVGLTLVMLMPIALVGIAAAIAMALRPFLGSETALWSVLGLFVVPVTLFAMLPSLVDKSFGERIAPGSAAARLLSGCFRWMKRLRMDGTDNTLVMYVYSQSKSFGKAAAAFGFSGMLLGFFAMTDAPRLAPVGTRANVVTDMEVADYASERGGALEYAMRASIPAPRVSGWLDLTVPVPSKQPRNDLPDCRDGNRDAVTACLSRHMRIAIDGKPVAADWQRQGAADGRPPALRALIDVRGLPRGKHHLTIDYLPNRAAPAQAWQERILFWN